MAKKDRLKSLIGAITESPIQEQQEASASGKRRESDVPTSLVEELGISPEMEEQLNEVRRRKVGRPKGRKSGNPKPRGDRATFVVDKSITRKLKYIALMETKLYKDIVSNALLSFVEGWEKKNGKINLPNTK